MAIFSSMCSRFSPPKRAQCKRCSQATKRRASSVQPPLKESASGVNPICASRSAHIFLCSSLGWFRRSSSSQQALATDRLPGRKADPQKHLWPIRCTSFRPRHFFGTINSCEYQPGSTLFRPLLCVINF